MTPLAACAAAYHAEIVPGLTEAHRACERELLAAGAPLPLPQRAAWLEAFGPAGARFVAVRDARGRCVGGLAFEVAQSRALPGHRLLRVQRYAPHPDPAVERALLGALRDHARGDGRVLRVGVELLSLDAARRRGAEALLRELGFVPAPDPRCYTHTLLVDLRPDEAGILASFHGTGRRHIRAAAKAPVEVRLVTEERWADRLDALLREAMGRTGGYVGRHDWPARIAFSADHPAQSRLVGLFRTDAEGPASLIAFAWGLCHGDHAHYDAGGSTRSPGVKVPMAYPLLWDLMRWAKAGGASSFDLGGVTFGTQGDPDDALGGISDFKRYFSREVAEVGGEWTFEPRPALAKLARGIGMLAGRVVALLGAAGVGAGS